MALNLDSEGYSEAQQAASLLAQHLTSSFSLVQNGYRTDTPERCLKARAGGQAVWEVGYAGVRRVSCFISLTKEIDCSTFQRRSEGHLADRLYSNPSCRLSSPYRWSIRQKAVQEGSDAHS